MSARRTPAHGTSVQLPGTLHGPAVTFKPGYKPPARTGGFVALTEEEQREWNANGTVIDPITQEKPRSALFKVQRPKRNETEEPVYDTRDPEQTWEWVKLSDSDGRMADTRVKIWYEDWWALYYTYGPIPLVPSFVESLPRLHAVTAPSPVPYPRYYGGPDNPVGRRLPDPPAEFLVEPPNPFGRGPAAHGSAFGPVRVRVRDQTLAGRFWVPGPFSNSEGFLDPTSAGDDLRGEVQAFFLARRVEFPYDIEALIRGMELYILTDYNRVMGMDVTEAYNNFPVMMVQYTLNNLTHRQAQDIMGVMRRGQAVGLQNLFGLPGNPHVPPNGDMQHLRPGDHLISPVPLNLSPEQYSSWEEDWRF